MRWVGALAICLIVSTSARADWGARRDPFDPNTVSRYKAILARDPYDAGALRQLVALYRGHRTVAKLEAEYRAQLAAGEDWAALVVLARMPSSDALVLWKRAVTVKPDDARGWIAVGDAAKTDATAARDAYLRAAQTAATPRQKRVALTKLVAAARDPATIDKAYVELIALAPNDGKLWLDRGNAQLAAKQFAPAKESFATAEALLRTDPERRLSAMTSQGIALEALGQSDDAIAQYERTLDSVPRGYFLGHEIVLRIIDTERKRGRLDAAVERLEKRWPERKRGYFEWSVLGDLYVEKQREDLAITAYRRAVTKAPTEVATQRKLIALLDKLHPTEALAQHEAAARLAPGDAALQLELAKRYHGAQQAAKALATLEALARRLSGSVNVRSSIATLYTEWNESARAIREYEMIAKLEPNEPDHAIVLGEAYWRGGQPEKALAVWQRLEKIATPEALFRHGEVLAMHDEWLAAAAAYTKSLALDPIAVEPLYGRGRAYEALERFADAADDARRAVALTHGAALDDGLRNRHLLVRVLGKWHEAGDQRALEQAVAKWRFAFDRGDLGAGYLLVAHHGRIRSDQHHGVLVELVRRAPADEALGLALARSYMHRRELGRAREVLQRLAKRAGARSKEVASMIEQVDEERARIERDIRFEEEGRRARNLTEQPDLVGKRSRFGLRFGIGTDVHETSGARMGIGFYRARGLAPGTAWAWRFDWTKYVDDVQTHKAVALGGVITKRLLDARMFELVAGVGPRVEVRYGGTVPSAAFDRAAIGGDITLELLPRALPATLGMRFDHSLTDGARSSALLVELGFEVR